MNFFAFGTNMDGSRVWRTIPTARRLGVARLNGYAVRWHKKTTRNGGGHLAAYRTDELDDVVWGVVYEIDDLGWARIDAGQREAGYREEREAVFGTDGTEYQVSVYVARDDMIDDSLLPVRSYRDPIVKAARASSLPPEYVTELANTPVAPLDVRMLSATPFTLRTLRTNDWPRIGELAEEAVAHVPMAGSQEEWCNNRRFFDSTTRAHREYVAEDPDIDEVVGYGAIESTGDEEFRMFVVTPPDRLASVGELLYAEGVKALHGLGARSVTMTEYAADEPLYLFAYGHGFQETRRWALPGGLDAVTLRKEL